MKSNQIEPTSNQTKQNGHQRKATQIQTTQTTSHNKARINIKIESAPNQIKLESNQTNPSQIIQYQIRLKINIKIKATVQSKQTKPFFKQKQNKIKLKSTSNQINAIKT